MGRHIHCTSMMIADTKYVRFISIAIVIKAIDKRFAHGFENKVYRLIDTSYIQHRKSNPKLKSIFSASSHRFSIQLYE